MPTDTLQATSGNVAWDVPTNWSLGRVPQAGDDVVVTGQASSSLAVSIAATDPAYTAGSLTETHPVAPVTLVVTAQSRLLGRTVASTIRADLVAAGIGDGRFSFELAFNPPLSPARSWLVHIWSEGSGEHLPGSPVRLPASGEFGPAARRAFSEEALDAALARALAA